MHAEVLKYMVDILKSANFLVLTPRELILKLLKPDIYTPDGWICGSHIESEFERFGALGFQAKIVLDELLREEVIDVKYVEDQGVNFAYYRKKLRPARGNC